MEDVAGAMEANMDLNVGYVLQLERHTEPRKRDEL
jgi:hypothetical protein